MAIPPASELEALRHVRTCTQCRYCFDREYVAGQFLTSERVDALNEAERLFRASIRADKREERKHPSSVSDLVYIVLALCAMLCTSNIRMSKWNPEHGSGWNTGLRYLKST